MSQPDEPGEREVKRLLYTSFSGIPGAVIDSSTLVRMWSLELQWLVPSDAEIVLEKLSNSGWLIEQDGGLTPHPSVEMVQPELGWQPIVRRVLNPPEFKASKQSSIPNDEPEIQVEEIHPESISPSIESTNESAETLSTETLSTDASSSPVVERKIVVKISDPEEKERSGKTVSEQPPDRAEANINSLIDLIAKKSALETREVVRRAQRKRRALGPVTLWMSLALVAREQGLDMVEVSEVIEAK